MRSRIENVKPEEVSVVKSPANKQRFLFWKSADGDESEHIIKLDEDIAVTFSSDGTPKGTSIEVNGVKLKKVDSFRLAYYKPGDSDVGPTVSCSYSRNVESGGGFKGQETFWLTKNKGENPMIKKFVEFMKKLSGNEAYSFVRKEGELSEDATEVIQKALDIISKNYSEDAPEDLKSAIVTLTEYAASALPVEKADDAETKDEKDEKVEKTETESAGDEVKAEDTLAKSVEEILASVKEVKETLEKSKDSMEAIETRLETVEKSSGARKSIKGQKPVVKADVEFPSMLDLE